MAKRYELSDEAWDDLNWETAGQISTLTHHILALSSRNQSLSSAGGGDNGQKAAIASYRTLHLLLANVSDFLAAVCNSS